MAERSLPCKTSSIKPASGVGNSCVFLRASRPRIVLTSTTLNIAKFSHPSACFIQEYRFIP